VSPGIKEKEWGIQGDRQKRKGPPSLIKIQPKGGNRWFNQTCNKDRTTACPHEIDRNFEILSLKMKKGISKTEERRLMGLKKKDVREPNAFHLFGEDGGGLGWILMVAWGEKKRRREGGWIEMGWQEGG